MVEFVHLDKCGSCGGNLIENTKSHYTCDSCDKHTFNSPVATVSPLIFKGDSTLLTIRAIEPRKGEYDTIGGFIDFMEPPLEALQREMVEETGVKLANPELVDAIVARYTNNQSVVDLHYLAELADPEAKMVPADDVAELEWVPVDQVAKTNVPPEKIPMIMKAYERYKQRAS